MIALAVKENGSKLDADRKREKICEKEIWKIAAMLRRRKGERSLGERTALSVSALKGGYVACRVPLLIVWLMTEVDS